MDTFENTTKEERTAALEALGLGLTAEFVPWSKSRNKGQKERSLNWKVTLSQGGKKLIRTDYMQGIAHAPSYQFRPTIHSKEATDWEAEHGVTPYSGSVSVSVLKGKPLPTPSLLEVCYCLGLDAQSGAESFEDFCASLGYDTDSRKARKMWKSCRKIAFKLGRELTEGINKVCG